MALDPAEFDRVLAQAKRGAPWALSVLYREFNPPIRRYLLARVPVDGEDLAADVWLAAAPKIPAFEGDMVGFRAWLFTFARRRAIDHGRRERRQGGPPGTLQEIHQRSTSDDPAAEALERVSATEAAQLVASHLTPEQSDVVLLRVLAGLEVDQVAATLGRPETWVRVTQHRALRRLARRLGSQIGVTR
ncbi:MAG TPA: sigma-70 family RNA polymerase sigma factor [Acidimicrobiales bacterium]|nr:sigma-70 family RNA polymerase sigma factor [Acidimicrobiales bacterium]